MSTITPQGYLIRTRQAITEAFGHAFVFAEGDATSQTYEIRRHPRGGAQAENADLRIKVDRGDLRIEVWAMHPTAAVLNVKSYDRLVELTDRVEETTADLSATLGEAIGAVQRITRVKARPITGAGQGAQVAYPLREPDHGSRRELTRDGGPEFNQDS